ncbi:ParB/RepB/Spo0J family partition protein [Cupriavidus basilensis]|jgi:ParB family chromosome partitioning protein|uniref:ParB/RepB/Spo0J family partition protein n=1 Tax=Cupriavidus basilensis TaxID=68895 RepID=UPI0023E8D3B8|nr:ParB/RepB/Spo0J family partition protein [Cupriavidus basilensis]MDF3889008.1 ParB/RepB/Spo0J family partition protein [Cupriavidus basilensis]
MDLSNLEALSGIVETPAVSDGKPLEWSVAKIIPGDNPRTDFDRPDVVAYIEQLSRSIARRGVKSPISVQPATSEEVVAYFTAAGKPLPDSLEDFRKINHGECRWRASALAKRETIPVFIDTQHDGFDALSENIQRRDLDPLDIAKRIKRYADQGLSKSAIANEIGYSPSYVSNHLKLLNLPEPVAQLVKHGKSSDVTALNMLGSAYADHPQQITEFCSQVEEFTQSQVRKLVSELASPPQVPPAPAPGAAISGDAQLNSLQTGQQEATDGDGGQNPRPVDGANGSTNSGGSNPPGDAGPNPSSAPQEKSSKIRVTAIEIRHDDRPARLLLKVPSSAGFAWIKYEEDGHEREIPADTIQQVVSVAVE